MRTRLALMAVALTPFLAQPGFAGVAPAAGGQSMSGAKVAPVKKPETEHQQGSGQAEERQDERK
jgi:hypothetical protein